MKIIDETIIINISNYFDIYGEEILPVADVNTLEIRSRVLMNL
jgi:hypothetical protein